MSWASERLEALKAGTVELMPVVKTLRNPGGDLLAKATAQQVLMQIPEQLRVPKTS